MDTRLVVSREERKCWTLLDKIDQHTLDLVKFFMPHERRLYAALNDGRFIAVGDNSKGLLGLGHKREVTTFEEITTLKGMSIKDIVVGQGCTMVVTEDGQLWGWGWNEFGQIGTGNVEDVLKPIRILEKDVLDVKCGFQYALALKNGGKVLVWGLNRCGQLGIGNTGIDTQLTPASPLSLDDVIIDQIETGGNYSIAVSRDGKAYGWGLNWDGQLRVGPRGKLFQPAALNVNNHCIKSVTCRYDCILFLTREGLMLVTQRGHGTLTQVEMNVHIERIACVDFELFLAWTSTELYYWGGIKPNFEETKPSSTDLSLSQIISQYSRHHSFPTVLYMQQEDEAETRLKEMTTNSIVKFSQNVSNLFDSPVFSDIEFVFPDGRTIKAHRLVLFASSEYLKTELSSTWDPLGLVALSSPSYSVFRHYLSYLYTKTLSFDDFDQLVSLARLALDYHENDLQQVCVQHLNRVQLDIDNCSQLFELAVDLQMEQLETQAKEMIVQNIARVRLTDGFKNMGRENASNFDL